jgi:hypothetical protein
MHDEGTTVSSPCHPTLEPEFFNILKFNLAESANAGFQFNCSDIFNNKTLN